MLAKATWCSLLLLLVVACGSNPPASIKDRSASSINKSVVVRRYASLLIKGKPYTVQRGDTLYAIAFYLGIDSRDLARRNNIASPYTIYPGQVIQTDVDRTVSSSVGDAPPAPTVSKSKGPTIIPRSTATSSTSVRSVSRASTRESVTSKHSQPATKTAPSAPVKRKATTLGLVAQWQWPSDGSVERKFSSALHKGVDITGKRGASVRATAPGVVVYSGTGVKGYGALVIVKHNEEFLSAYGHNDAILVKEGQSVAAGQQIAQMGSSGTNSVKLHFEIRRRGKPVDPLTLLPKH